MINKRILILGARRYNLPAIQAARRAGFWALVADPNREEPGLVVADVALPIDLLDIEGLLRAVRQNGGVDGVVTLAEVGVRSAAVLARHLGLPSCSEEVAAIVTSKAALRERWKALGRLSPDFLVVRSEAEALRAADRLGVWPLVLKPDRSFGGSRGVSRVDSRQQLAGAYRFAQSGGLPGSAVVLESFVSGSEHSAEVLIWKGKAHVLCVGEKVKSGYPYRVDISVQYPAGLDPEQLERVADMCQRAVEAIGLTHGVAHIEFAYTKAGPVLFELGARCGGGLTPEIAHHVSGVNEFIEYCRMACGLPPSKLRPERRLGADYRFLVLQPGKLSSIVVPAAVQGHPRILDIATMIEPGDEVGELRTTAERSGFLVAVGADRAQASQLADWACERITATYADGRAAPVCSLSDSRRPRPDGEGLFEYQALRRGSG
jgi:biotin carboxylase